MFGGQDGSAQAPQSAAPATNPATDGTLNGVSDLIGPQQSAPTPPAPTPTGAPTFDPNSGFIASDSEPAAAPGAPVAEEAKPEPTTSASAGPDSEQLLDIKQQALRQLSPLVGHLEQTPEEKFRTTMMLIQASDNKDLIKDAYEAAQAIPDEKVKAQALLDVINEINYFTQQQAEKPE